VRVGTGVVPWYEPPDDGLLDAVAGLCDSTCTESTPGSETGTTSSVVGRAVLSAMRSAVEVTRTIDVVESPGCGCHNDGDAEGASEGKTTSRTANALAAHTVRVMIQAIGIEPRRSMRAVLDHNVAQVELAADVTPTQFTPSSFTSPSCRGRAERGSGHWY
jgi:hypothetical protein